MASFEVKFTVSEPTFGPNSARRTDASLINAKTVVEAFTAGQAEALVRAQFGPGCQTFGAVKRN